MGVNPGYKTSSIGGLVDKMTDQKMSAMYVVVVPADGGPTRCEPVTRQCMSYLDDLERLVGNEIELGVYEHGGSWGMVAYSEYGRGLDRNHRASTMMGAPIPLPGVRIMRCIGSGRGIRGTAVFCDESVGDDGDTVYGYTHQAAQELKMTIDTI